jgi:hypothetical protein
VESVEKERRYINTGYLPSINISNIYIFEEPPRNQGLAKVDRQEIDLKCGEASAFNVICCQKCCY